MTESKFSFFGYITASIFCLIVGVVSTTSTIGYLYEGMIDKTENNSYINLPFLTSLAFVFGNIGCSIVRQLKKDKTAKLVLLIVSLFLSCDEIFIMCGSMITISSKDNNDLSRIDKNIEQLKQSIKSHENTAEGYRNSATQHNLNADRYSSSVWTKNKDKAPKESNLAELDLEKAKEEDRVIDLKREELIKLENSKKTTISTSMGDKYSIINSVSRSLLLAILSPLFFTLFGLCIKEIFVIVNPNITTPPCLKNEHNAEKEAFKCGTTPNASQTDLQTLLNANANGSPNASYTHRQELYKRTKEDEKKIKKINDRKSFNDSIEKGNIVNCPMCEKPFLKQRSNHIFCPGSSCKNDYHNLLNPSRIEAKNNRFNNVYKLISNK